MSSPRFASWRQVHLLIALLFFLGALSFAGCEAKRSSSNSGGEGAEEGGGESQYEHVQGPGKERIPEQSTEKAARVIRQLTNYLLGIQATQGTPADLDTAKAALQKKHQMTWPKDPWGQPYVYKVNGDQFEIYSLGPDKQEGTGDEVRATP